GIVHHIFDRFTRHRALEFVLCHGSDMDEEEGNPLAGTMAHSVLRVRRKATALRAESRVLDEILASTPRFVRSRKLVFIVGTTVALQYAASASFWEHAMKPRPACRLAFAAAAMLYALVGHAQDASYFNAPATTSAQAAADETAPGGFFVAPLGGTGLNADRARGYGGGLRLLPDSGAFIGYQMGNWTIGSALHRESDLERATWLDMSASYGLNLSRKHRIS